MIRGRCGYCRLPFYVPWLLGPNEIGADARDLDLRVLLPVRALAQVVLAAAELDDDFLLALAVFLDGGRDLAALEQRSANLDVVAVCDEQDFAELDR